VAIVLKPLLRVFEWNWDVPGQSDWPRELLDGKPDYNVSAVGPERRYLTSVFIDLVGYTLCPSSLILKTFDCCSVGIRTRP